MEQTAKYIEVQNIKQELKRIHQKGTSPEGLHLLAELVEEDVQAVRSPITSWDEWYRVMAYETIYEVAFNRGVRHERQRRKAKSKPLTAFDTIGAIDVKALSHELGISQDKLTCAVLEVIAKRKNGGLK